MLTGKRDVDAAALIQVFDEQTSVVAEKDQKQALALYLKFYEQIRGAVVAKTDVGNALGQVAEHMSGLCTVSESDKKDLSLKIKYLAEALNLYSDKPVSADSWKVANLYRSLISLRVQSGESAKQITEDCDKAIANVKQVNPKDQSKLSSLMQLKATIIGWDQVNDTASKEAIDTLRKAADALPDASIKAKIYEKIGFIYYDRIKKAEDKNGSVSNDDRDAALVCFKQSYDVLKNRDVLYKMAVLLTEMGYDSGKSDYDMNVFFGNKIRNTAGLSLDFILKEIKSAASEIAGPPTSAENCPQVLKYVFLGMVLDSRQKAGGGGFAARRGWDWLYGNDDKNKIGGQRGAYYFVAASEYWKGTGDATQREKFAQLVDAFFYDNSQHAKGSYNVCWHCLTQPQVSLEGIDTYTTQTLMGRDYSEPGTKEFKLSDWDV